MSDQSRPERTIQRKNYVSATKLSNYVSQLVEGFFSDIYVKGSLLGSLQGSLLKLWSLGLHRKLNHKSSFQIFEQPNSFKISRNFVKCVNLSGKTVLFAT